MVYDLVIDFSLKNVHLLINIGRHELSNFHGCLLRDAVVRNLRLKLFYRFLNVLNELRLVLGKLFDLKPSLSIKESSFTLNELEIVKSFLN